MELSHWLENFYLENNGKNNWRLAVTGNLCIGRGITFQSEQCSFSNALIAPNISKSNKSELYQICCRMCGPIKRFKRFQESGPPVIICKERTWKSICEAEKTIYAICRQAAKGNARLTKDLYCTAEGLSKERNVLFCGADLNDPLRSYDPEPFLTVEAAIEWIESIRGRKYKYMHTNYEKLNREGKTWLLSKRTGKAHKVTDRYKVTWDELLRTGGGGGVNSSTQQRIIPCYLDPTDPKSLRWSAVVYKPE